MKAQFIELSPPNEKTILIKQVDQEFLSNPLHFHELCELVLILESYGKRVVGNHVDSFSAGDLVLMGPNIPHIWRNDDIFLNPQHDERARAIVLYFPADFLLRLTDDQATISAMQQFIKRSKRGLRFHGQTLEQATELIKSLAQKKSFSRITGFLNLIELLHQAEECENLASEGYKPTFGEQETNRINNVYIYVMQNFREEVSLGIAAELVNMTPNAFCRFFKRHTQKSFSKFVNEMRIGHACKLLMNKQLSISEICYQSGYQNLTNFNKFFKTIMRKSPREYRKEMDM
ncbi:MULTISPECIES: AraC family transcriptional regulator [Sphingobacterium]|uniref:AraC family transcriptional regulator n=1 Tax=Sphingobacterium TaxID=28453 RepID=UPI001050B619|nr:MULTISPECIES: AraC family transcriptional regulator [Sphingobacterium]MBB2949543.1 AraC-like DNA-binding protein [Sphingobacterium sp. JUb56]MCS3554260.1 AraC-like DNA-binding protein [Sphingobacterium sp. JUb21]MCW2263359.1 AraC-like DNA-binding protein [Sphingobacterium kitahiroshimense]NJI74271.1 AraC family transcriptional regulator [Sphingobacterium sp. B16(2022)]TCR08093.1 AraC-like DNA-binding protein [Sphingobacterium sp. JUb20]